MYSNSKPVKNVQYNVHFQKISKPTHENSFEDVLNNSVDHNQNPEG